MIVYFHRNCTTNEVFYVGIGLNKIRAYRLTGTQRNQYWHNYVKKHGLPIVEIAHEVETRQEAEKLELKYIADFGRRCDGSGCLVNITIGGDGGSLGMKQSKEHIQKRMKNLRGRVCSEQERLKMKEVQNRPDVKAKHAKYKSDPTWIEKQRQAKLGKKHSEETKQKRANAAKKVLLNTQTGIFYWGIKEAAEAGCLNVSTLRGNGHKLNNTPFIYA